MGELILEGILRRLDHARSAIVGSVTICACTYVICCVAGIVALILGAVVATSSPRGIVSADIDIKSYV
jgi:hypothetical protein